MIFFCLKQLISKLFQESLEPTQTDDGASTLPPSCDTPITEEALSPASSVVSEADTLVRSKQLKKTGGKVPTATGGKGPTTTTGGKGPTTTTGDKGPPTGGKAPSATGGKVKLGRRSSTRIRTKTGVSTVI